MNRITLLAAISVLVTGCSTNRFSQFYLDRSATVASRCLPYSGKTQIIATSDPLRDTTNMFQSGYLPIGESGFWCVGWTVTQQMLEEQAKKVKADVVLYFTKYEGSEQGYAAIPQYHPGTPAPTITQNVNVYGNGYQAEAGDVFGRMAVQTMQQNPPPTTGTYTTTVVPVTRQRYTHAAGFWRKGKPPIFGAYFINLTPELREKLQKNTGVVVAILVNDSPAFRANILPGDILTRIDDVEISSTQDFQAKLLQFAGKKATLSILRNDATLTIPIQMNEAN
ncbi:MAG TPA: PDZ domain-containing protein [Verrucomicrobiae bacterium]|nr:PDZ domain-containing protein [Verrucomicrobiae bacterium]